MTLPTDFTIEKYGVRARFVEEGDAGFIVDLRTDGALSKYIHATDNNLQTQVDWIRSYKNRETEGKEYYFIFYVMDIPYGVERIYNIKGDSFEHGSLVFKQESPLGASIKADIITREVGFDLLGKQTNLFDVCKGNNGVISYHMRYKPVVVSEDEESFHYSLSKENFDRYKKIYMKLLNL